MTQHFVHIDAGKLKDVIGGKEMSHAQLAQLMSISKKTIQRWVNGQITRVRVETMDKLSAVLSVEKENLVKEESVISRSCRNKAVDEALNEEFFTAFYITDNLEPYLRILRSFPLHSLPSSQQSEVLIQLGTLSLSLWQIRAGVIYLKEAIKICKVTEDYQGLVTCLSWMSVAYNLSGQFETALKFNSEAESIAKTHDFTERYPEIFYKTGQILFSMNRYSEAKSYVKKSIVLEYHGQNVNYISQVNRYMQLSSIYLSMRSYENALKHSLRAVRIAEKKGYLRGQISGLHQAAMASFLEKDFEESKKYFHEAKKIEKYVQANHEDYRNLRVEFIWHLKTKNFEAARLNTIKRLRLSRRLSLVNAMVKLDYLLLSKASGGVIPFRKSFESSAEETFVKYKQEHQLQIMKKIAQLESGTDFDDLVECISF
ncbi:MAG: helix-turn-helix transcriptional regulator [Bdellovibrio sp.]|nr:helix-turn-helix transcriptional regulator [Bdellovibrio sp.]